MPKPVPFGLSAPAVGQLIRLQRRPIEAVFGNGVLSQLHRAGFATCRPLVRPSGSPSRYREWSITDDGRTAVEILKEIANG